MSTEKTKPKKNKEQDIVNIIKQCAKCNVKTIKVGDIEIEFHGPKEISKQAKLKIVEAISEDPEFNEEAKKYQEELDEFNEDLKRENEVLENFEDYEERAIKQAMEIGNGE